MDHAMVRSWRPHSVLRRAEAHRRKADKDKERGKPVLGVYYMHTRSEQKKEEEKGMPTLVLKDSRTKMTMAKVAPNEGAVDYTVGVARKMIEQLGHTKAILKSDNEPAILAFKEAARRDRERDSAGRGSSRRPLGKRIGGECG